MGLKSLIERLKTPGADTPDTSKKSTGYQRKAPAHAGCTPDTPDTSHSTEAYAVTPAGRFDEAGMGSVAELPDKSHKWAALATAYHLHHFACPICIGVGRGAVYGHRCSVGAALWNNYQGSK
jgi:hypothetical protein